MHGKEKPDLKSSDERYTGNTSDRIKLSSAKSMQVSLQSVRSGKAGLDAHRESMLSRIPKQGDWAKFEFNSIELKDLAYLTAKTGDEFALLRGKKEDILFHGDALNCNFVGLIGDMLLDHKLELIGHSHPSEDRPIASSNDRWALKRIGQAKSTIISARTGMCTEFSQNEFEKL